MRSRGTELEGASASAASSARFFLAPMVTSRPALSRASNSPNSLSARITIFTDALMMRPGPLAASPFCASIQTISSISRSIHAGFAISRTGFR